MTQVSLDMQAGRIGDMLGQVEKVGESPEPRGGREVASILVEGEVLTEGKPWVWQGGMGTGQVVSTC